jgi:hypothetical protein
MASMMPNFNTVVIYVIIVLPIHATPWVKGRYRGYNTLKIGIQENQESRRSRGSQQSQESQGSQQKDPALERIDQLCLELCMTLLNHELIDDEYESVIISGLAVLGFQGDGGWLNAEDYTTKYSGFIKVARMLVIYQPYIEWEAEYVINRKFWDDV